MKSFTYIVILAISLLASSCIKEDYDDCKVRVKLLFSYLGDGDTEIFMDKHEKVNLYVYNSSNDFILKKEISKDELTKLQGTYLSLMPGDYRVICWGNILDKTNVSESSFNNARIGHHPDADDNNCVQTIDSLYYGTYNLNVPKTDKLVKDTLISDIVPFQGAHIKFSIKINGLEKVFPNATTTPIRMSLHGLPLTCNFEKINTEDKCSYNIALSNNNLRSAGTLYSAFNSMRFPNNNNISLKLIRNSDNNELYSLQLKDFLDKINLNVENKHEVLVPILIEFDGNAANIGIEVSKWNEVILEPFIN